MLGSAGTRRAIAAGALLALGVGVAPLTRAATPPPLFFAARLEGYAVRASATAQARTLDPGSGYSFASVGSTAALDGSRDLQMKATGTTNDPGNLGGAALFTPDSPTSGTSNFPNFSEAFFPAFEAVGQSSVAEKCSLNAASKESPECRDQPGPYALARVVPEPDAPSAEGFARNGGSGEDGGESVTRSRISAGDAGEIIGVQRNEGRSIAVPGTPVVVESFLATSKVTATPDGVSAEGTCTAEVTVGGEPVTTNEELQALLGPLTGTAVEYQPPTEAAVTETFGGTKEVTCTGARISVTGPDATLDYTFGQTFATASPPSDAGGLSASGVLGGTFGGGTSSAGGPTLSRSPAPGVLPAGGPTATPGTVGSSRSTTPPPSGAGGGQAAGSPGAAGLSRSPIGGGALSAAAPPALLRTKLDTFPIALTTAAAATVLPLGVVLLWAVVGSLARGLPALRFPPFRD